ncbi:MAG: hypothetical protein MK010_02180, partial [Erythrobacter sp.]|nr:hypothetical protein [Erythrobacter sp.]
TSEEELIETPAFCGDCRDHNLLALKRAAVQRMQAAKRASKRSLRDGVRSTTDEDFWMFGEMGY